MCWGPSLARHIQAWAPHGYAAPSLATLSGMYCCDARELPHVWAPLDARANAMIATILFLPALILVLCLTDARPFLTLIYRCAK